MAVIRGCGPLLCAIPLRARKQPGRPLAVCSRRRGSPVWPCVVYSARSARGARERHRFDQKAEDSLRLYIPRASSGNDGEGGDGNDGGGRREDGKSDDEEGQSDGIEAEDEGVADRVPGNDDKEAGGIWRSIWRRKRSRKDKLEEEDSTASERLEDEEILETPSGERRRGWRFPWDWDAERERNEQEAREEEAEQERRIREGIFVLDIDNESLELRWQDLLDPTVENVLALILTGCLVLAIVQILWQLFIVAAAITVSAIKYTVLAIFLIGILVFLV